MFLQLLLRVTLTSASPIASRDVSFPNVETAFHNLQQWHDSSTGLWQGMWWHSGSIVSTLCNLARLDASLQSEITSILSNTYTAAQAYTYDAKSAQGFTGDYYDDEGWWALGWVDAYDLTGSTQYLSTAEGIFADMYQSFGKTPCSQNSAGTGGIPWGRVSSYVNSIPNELFLTLATKLSTRVQEGAAIDYGDVARKQWAWMKGAGLLRDDNLVVDGLLSDCSAGRSGWAGNVWTYNQGVLLPALALLDVPAAHGIASATLAALAADGILRDPCEHNITAAGANTCDGDQTQFKGIFVRGLEELYRASPRQEYAEFFRSNAESLWEKGQEGGLMSVSWDGPFLGPANASTQSSGLDLLVAAVAVQS